MSNFVERHGYVKYPVIRYMAEGPCEIPGCVQRQKQIEALYREQYHEEPVELPIDQFTKRIMTESEGWSALYFAATNKGKNRYEVDHCHAHGWVRGIVCRSCNNKLPVINRPSFGLDFISSHYGVELETIDYAGYLLNCPECAGKPVPVASRVSSEFIRVANPTGIRQLKDCPLCGGDGDHFDGWESRVPCERCEGTGKVTDLSKDKCGSCGKQRTIIDEINVLCRECSEQEAQAYSEQPFCLTHGGEVCDGFGCQEIYV